MLIVVTVLQEWTVASPDQVSATAVPVSTKPQAFGNAHSCTHPRTHTYASPHAPALHSLSLGPLLQWLDQQGTHQTAFLSSSDLTDSPGLLSEPLAQGRQKQLPILICGEDQGGFPIVISTALRPRPTPFLSG